jgi:transposase
MQPLGIDISKNDFRVALLLGEKVRQKKFRNEVGEFSALTDWLAKQGVTTVHACLEATGTYGEALAIYLYQAGHVVSIVNPARIKAFAQTELTRNKTDRLDATLIARFCQMHKPAAWVPSPPEIRELRALVRHLDDLLETRTQLQNRLGNALLVNTVEVSFQTLIEAVENQITEIERKIRSHIDGSGDLKACRDLLTSIPGIGALTAARLLGEIEHLRHYRHARQVVAYAGLSPKHRESGTFRGRVKLSKIGNRHIRKALYFPAITALRFNPVIRELGRRLEQSGKCKMVIIGAAMRKLLHIAFGVLKTRTLFVENHRLAA